MKKALFFIAGIISSILLFAQQNTSANEGRNYFPNYHPLVVHFP